MSKRKKPVPASLPVPPGTTSTIAPAVRIRPVPYSAPNEPPKPRGGELLTRQAGPTGYLGNIAYSQDPGTPTSGAQTYQYGQVANNPNVKQIINLLVSGPFWGQYHIAPSNDYTRFPEFEEIDQILQQCVIDQLDGVQGETFRNILKSIWQDAYTYGFSVSEFVWPTDPVTGDTIYDADGKIWLQTIKVHSPYLFDIYTSTINEIQSVTYRQTGQQVVEGDLEGLLIVTYPYFSHGNPYGQSGLISVLPDVLAINALEKAQSEGARALAIKSLLHHYLAENMEENEVEEVRADLANMMSGSVVSWPADIDKDGKLAPMHSVEVIEDRASAAGLDIINKYLDRLYKRVSRNMGLPDDLGFTGTNIGSLAKAAEESNLYLQCLADAQLFIADFVNRQIIPLLIKYNYPEALEDPDYRIPQFTFASVDTNAAVDLYPLIAAYNADLISRTEFRAAAGYDAPIDPGDTASVLKAKIEQTPATALDDPDPGAVTPESEPATQFKLFQLLSGKAKLPRVG